MFTMAIFERAADLFREPPDFCRSGYGERDGGRGYGWGRDDRQETRKPPEQITVKLSYKSKTGRYFASVGACHVFSGKDLDDLARQMASPDGMYLENIKVVPGLSRVRTGRGKLYIKGTKPASSYDTTDLIEKFNRYRPEAMDAKRARIAATAEETARQNERSRIANEEALRRQAETPADTQKGPAPVRHHGYTDRRRPWHSGFF
jgi:hypothetical protein